jgi:hypothetical protein
MNIFGGKDLVKGKDGGDIRYWKGGMTLRFVWCCCQPQSQCYYWFVYLFIEDTVCEWRFPFYPIFARTPKKPTLSFKPFFASYLSLYLYISPSLLFSLTTPFRCLSYYVVGPLCPLSAGCPPRAITPAARHINQHVRAQNRADSVVVRVWHIHQNILSVSLPLSFHGVILSFVTDGKQHNY